MSKKVIFAEDAKKYDGVILSDRSLCFYKIVCGYFNALSSKEKYKIKKVIEHKIETDVRNTYDILVLVGFKEEVLKYCRYRLAYLIKRLAEKNLSIDNKENIYHKDEKDPYWDNTFFVERAKKKSKEYGKCVSIVSRGCRDFNLSFKTEHLIHLHKLYELIKSADNENEWVML